MTGESWASSPSIRRTMQACKGRDTSSELRLRRAVHRLGLRYTVDARPIKGVRRKADLVFPREQLAIFLDGCFWHGCMVHYTAPAAHGDFWAAKLAGNIARDRETDRVLMGAGWTVLRVWEHEDPSTAAQQILELVTTLRQGGLVPAVSRTRPELG